MRFATFPPIRVEPEVRAEVEAVPREGASLTPFIEESVVAAAARRRAQAAFVQRGEAAIERWKQKGGKGLILLDQVRTVDRVRLVKKLGAVSKKTLSAASSTLQEVFAE